jgi:zinc protease
MVGSNDAPEGFPGMAHAEEHMMFRGSPGLSADQLSNIVAALGGDFNADTQQTVTQYFFTVPSQYLDIALHIESIRMSGGLREQTLWEQERGAIDQEVARDLSNPQYKYYIQLLEAMFAGTPYAHDALGTKDSFSKTSGDMLQKFHKDWYAPNNAILVIVGDVDPVKAFEETKRLFASIPARVTPQKQQVHLTPLKSATIKLDTDLPYGLAIVAYRLPGYESPDFAAGQVLADVLSSQRGKLYDLVTEGKALFAGFDAQELPIATIGYAAGAVPQDVDPSIMVSTLKDIVAGYAKNGVPPELIEAAKRHEVADAEFEKNSVSGLAAAWSDALAVEGRNSPEDGINAIRTVTSADVNRVAKEYLKNDTAIVAILTPHPSGEPIVSQGFGGKESFAPKQTGAVQLPDWAQKLEAMPQVPASHLHPVVTTLANGLKLIVHQESISPTVSVFGEIKTNPDLLTPPAQEGVSGVLNELFSYGTTTLDRLSFQKALDDIAADESAGSSFSLEVLAEHLESGLELLSSNLLQPALPLPAFKVVQKEAEDAAAGTLKSPEYLAHYAALKGLYPKNDPALRQATPSAISSLTLENVRDYYSKAFRPDLTTIVVIGQVAPEKAKALIEKYFGNWKTNGTKPETDLPPVPANKQSIAVIPDESRIQDEVTLTETLGLTRSDKDYYALQLGNHVLSGAFYATRLYHDLREEAGLVYTVESSLDVGRSRSLFQVYYASDPDKVGKAHALVIENLKKMQSEPITPKELQQATTLLLMQIPLAESSENEIASQLLQLSMKDLPLDEPIHAAHTYIETTSEQVREAFKKWVRPDDFVEVVRGPKPQ